MPAHSRLRKLKHKICSIFKHNDNQEPPPPYIEKVVAKKEPIRIKDKRSEQCLDGENSLKENKSQQAVDELRNMIRHKLMHRYLLITSPTVILSLDDHSLELSSKLQNVHQQTPRALWPDLSKYLRETNFETYKKSFLRRMVTWLQEYIVEPAKILGLDEVEVRTLLTDRLQSSVYGGFPGPIGYWIWYGKWTELDRRLKKDRRMLEVFRDATSIEKATRKETSLHTAMCAALDRVQSICKNKAV